MIHECLRATARRGFTLLAVCLLLGGLARGARAQDPPPADARGTEDDSGDGGPREPYRNPDTVALRSLVIPGWGQQVNGETGKGWFLTTLAAVGILLGTETLQLGLLTAGRTEHNLERDVGWFLYGGSVAWATIDGYLTAQRINRENGYDLVGGPGPPASPGVRLTLLRVDF